MSSKHTNLIAIFTLLVVSVSFNACFSSEPEAPLSKEEERVQKEQKLHAGIEQTYPEAYALAKESGHQGYIEFKSIEQFVAEYEYGRIDIHNYKDYIISNSSGATYAYLYSKRIEDISLYTPNSKYGWVHTIGIKLHDKDAPEPQRGEPLKDTRTVKFLGVHKYKTIFGVYKKFLLFERMDNDLNHNTLHEK